jgi:hypothetical protein
MNNTHKLASVLLLAVLVFSGAADAHAIRFATQQDHQNFCTMRNNKVRIGSRGQDVKKVQEILKFTSGLDSANSITVDGKFGLKTARVVREFQARNELRPDGVVGASTRAKLYEVCTGNQVATTQSTATTVQLGNYFTMNSGDTVSVSPTNATVELVSATQRTCPAGSVCATVVEYDYVVRITTGSTSTVHAMASDSTAKIAFGGDYLLSARGIAADESHTFFAEGMNAY